MKLCVYGFGRLAGANPVQKYSGIEQPGRRGLHQHMASTAAVNSSSDSSAGIRPYIAA